MLIARARKETPEDWLQRQTQLPMLLFLYGEDEGRITSFVTLVRRRCLGEAPVDFNLNVFDASEVPITRVLEAAQTLPVLSAARVVQVSNASSYRKVDWQQALGYLRNPSPSTCLIFRGRTKPDSKEVMDLFAERAGLVEFRPRSERQAEAWIQQRAAQEGKVIEDGAIALLLDRAGTRQGDLEREIEKLLIFVDQRKKIREEDVLAAATGIRSHTLFELTDALSEQRGADALRILHRLLDEGTAPLALLGMLARQLRLLWLAGSAAGAGGRERLQCTKKFSVPPFVRERLIKQARNWNEASLRRAYAALVRLDHCFKGGHLEPGVLLDRWVLVAVGSKEKPSGERQRRKKTAQGLKDSRH
jgi:DNA polymerase-3 subunit delta